MATSKVSIAITGDASGLKKAAGEAEGSLGRLDGKMSSFGKDMIGGFATGAGVAAITSFAQDGIKLASDLSEATSKNAKIYKGNADEIAAAGETAAESLGMSKAAYAEAAGQLGLLGQAAGLTGTDLSNFATTAAQRAADIGSFNNAATPEVIEAWGSAMRGEMEPMRRFGVALDDATLRQKALKMGLIDTVKTALTPQQKALAANALIMEQTTIAAGDFKDTSDGLANQQKILKARIDDLKIALGEGLTPALLAAGEGFADTMEKADGLFKNIGGNEGAMKALTSAIGMGLKGMSSSQAGMMAAWGQAKTTADEAAVAEKRLAEETRYAGSAADLYVKSLVARHDAGKAAERAAETQEEAEKALKEQLKNLEQAAKDAAKGLEEEESAAKNLLKASQSLYLSQLDLEETIQHFPEGLEALKKSHEEVVTAEKNHGAGSDQLRVAHEKQADALRTLQRDIDGVAGAALKAAEDKKAAAGGGELTALEMYQSQATALDELALTFPEIKVAIDEYKAKALDPLVTKSGLVRDALVQDAKDIAAEWRNADGTITVTADRIDRESGTAAPAPTGGGAGKRGAAQSFDGFASGGVPVMSSAAPVNITVNALSPQQAATAVLDAIKAYERTNGTGWRS